MVNIVNCHHQRIKTIDHVNRAHEVGPQRRYSPLSLRTSSQNIWFGNMKEIKCFDFSWENLFQILCSMYKYKLYRTMQTVENYIYYFYGVCNPETGIMLSKLKTFKTLCAAFPARVTLFI